MNIQTKLNISALVGCLFGFYLGWSFTNYSNFQYSKFLNISGLTLDMLGVALLSGVILTRRSIQKSIADELTRFTLIFSSCFPASMALASMFSFSDNFSLAIPVLKAASIFSVTLLVPCLVIFQTPMLEPALDEPYTPETRIKILGSRFIVVGFALQIIGSTADLLSDA